MTGLDDIQSFIERLGEGVESVQEVETGLWVLEPNAEGVRVVVRFEPPVVVFRVNVMELPADATQRQSLMRKLLELNASELVHGSYGIEGNHAVMTDALELEDLDFSEFQASFDSITLALASHLPLLSAFQEK